MSCVISAVVTSLVGKSVSRCASWPAASRPAEISCGRGRDGSVGGLLRRLWRAAATGEQEESDEGGDAHSSRGRAGRDVLLQAALSKPAGTPPNGRQALAGFVSAT